MAGAVQSGERLSQYRGRLLSPAQASVLRSAAQAYWSLLVLKERRASWETSCSTRPAGYSSSALHTHVRQNPADGDDGHDNSVGSAVLPVQRRQPYGGLLHRCHI